MMVFVRRVLAVVALAFLVAFAPQSAWAAGPGLTPGDPGCDGSFQHSVGELEYHCLGSFSGGALQGLTDPPPLSQSLWIILVVPAGEFPLPDQSNWLTAADRAYAACTAPAGDIFALRQVGAATFPEVDPATPGCAVTPPAESVTWSSEVTPAVGVAAIGSSLGLFLLSVIAVGTWRR